MLKIFTRQFFTALYNNAHHDTFSVNEETPRLHINCFIFESHIKIYFKIKQISYWKNEMELLINSTISHVRKVHKINSFN